MKQYHVVFKGLDGFQKEEVLTFENNDPIITYYIREYQQLSIKPLSSISPFTSETLSIKHRAFRKQCEFYALGKNIVYYKEERY